jgi:hypothetical protein
MRKSVAGLILVASVSMASVTEATYVIKLKNGNEYITNRYWHEGSQILFDAEGGVFGIDKVFVDKIEKADRVVKLVTVAERDPSDNPQPSPDKKETESTKQMPAPDAKARAEKDENDPIVLDVAKLKERSENLRSMFPEDIRALIKDISDYRTKILKDSKLFIDYGREFNELQKMGAAADNALRK